MSQRTPTLPEVLNRARGSLMADLHVALPGRVERWDPATQLVDVQPLVAGTVEQEDGSIVNRRLPIVTNVPLVFPAAGGFRLTFPVQPGDTVLLVFADRSIDAWLAQGGEASPADQRRHDLSDAVAIPGLHPNNAVLTEMSSTAMQLGANGQLADFVALAAKVLAELTALKDAFAAWTPVPGDGGTALKVLLTGIISGGWPHSVASGTVQILG